MTIVVDLLKYQKVCCYDITFCSCLVGSGSEYCVWVERHVYLGSVVWLALGQNIMSEWSDISIWGLLFGWLWVRILCLSGVTCLSGDCCLVGSGSEYCVWVEWHVYLGSVVWLALGQDIVSEWSDMSIWGLLFGWLWVRILCLSGVTCLSGDCCLVGSGSG
jgi:hypothetical protein